MRTFLGENGERARDEQMGFFASPRSRRLALQGVIRSSTRCAGIGGEAQQQPLITFSYRRLPSQRGGQPIAEFAPIGSSSRFPRGEHASAQACQESMLVDEAAQDAEVSEM
jgi:hypothetical protein